MKVFVVTNPELGWDCVVGVYTDKKYVNTKFRDRDEYIIHEQSLSETKLSSGPDQRLVKYGRTQKKYTVKDYKEASKSFLLFDESNEVYIGGDSEHSKEHISLILDHFEVFCKEQKIK